MEENTTPVVATETTTVEPAPTSTATAATNKKKMALIALAVIGLAAVAIAAVLILTNRQQGTVVTTTAAGTGLNVSDREAATAKLNSNFPTYYKMMVTSGTEQAQVLTALGANAIEGTLIKATVQTQVDNQPFNVVVDAKSNKAQSEGSVNLQGKVTGLGDLNANIDFKTVSAEQAFMMVRDLPAEVSMYLTQLGVSQDKWYKFPEALLKMSTDLSGSLSSSTEFEGLDSLDAGTQVFINPQAKPNRTVFGANLACMSVELNPAVSDQAQELGSVEICNNDTLFPLYIGFASVQEGTPVTVGFEIAETSAFTVEAPAGAVEATFLTDLFNSFLGGSAGAAGGTMPNIDELNEDGSGLTPEELQEYEDLMDLYYR